MRRHPTTAELLYLLEGETSPEPMEALLDHLDDCRACARDWETIVELRAHRDVALEAVRRLRARRRLGMVAYPVTATLPVGPDSERIAFEALAAYRQIDDDGPDDRTTRFYDHLFADAHFDPIGQIRAGLEAVRMFVRNPRRYIWARLISRRLRADLERDGIPSDETLDAFDRYRDHYESDPAGTN